MKLFDTFRGKKSQQAKHDGRYTIQSHLAEYLAFLMSFFTDYEYIKTTFKFENEPNNLNGLMKFALFLDLTTNLPSIFTENNTIDMKDIIRRFVKGSVNAIPKLGRIFKDTQIDQTTERLMLYAQLLNDDLKSRDTCNYQSVHEFLKEVFSGKITEEEKVVLTNMLTTKLPAINSLIMMQISSFGVETSTNVDDYFNCGMEYLFSDNNKAINEFTHAIELNINHKDSYLQRGIAFYELKQFKEALADFEKVREIDPTIHEALFHMGNCYLKIQEYLLAKRCFMLCAANNFRSPLYYYKYGIACSRLKDYQISIKSFSIAIKLGGDSLSPNVYYERGIAFYNLNDYNDLALKDFQHYLEYRHDDYRAYYWMGHVYGRLKEHEKSLEYMTKAISLNPLWSKAYRVRGLINRILERYDDAIMDFSKAVEINSEDIKSYILRSMLHKEKGNYSEAKQDLLQVLRIDPDNIEAKEKLISIQPIQGN